MSVLCKIHLVHDDCLILKNAKNLHKWIVLCRFFVLKMSVASVFCHAEKKYRREIKKYLPTI